MAVREWMTSDPVTVTPSDRVAEARQLMHRYGIRHLPVVEDDGRLVGIVSDRDVRIDEAALARMTAVSIAVLAEAVGDERSIEAVMSASPHVIHVDEPVEAAARLMLSRRVSALPVIDDDHTLVGVITSTDCLLASLSRQDVGGTA
ncbi:MAG: CBS domain-containing protein [Egibacteraceae bacterium]